MYFEGDAAGAAHIWDGLRALIGQVHGPEDPRGWASLTRAAALLAEFAFGPDSLPSGQTELARRPALSLAEGALGALRDAFARLPGLSGPGWAAAEGWRDWEQVRDAETAFAEATLSWTRARAAVCKIRASGKAGRSLAEALYHGHDPEAMRSGFPSSEELRARLSDAEGPGGPGPKSREALVLKSRLGFELWDSGGRSDAVESLALLKKASAGLDRLAGKSDPDSFAARDLLARRLSGMYGFGRIVPLEYEIPPPENMLAARRLFRSLGKLRQQVDLDETYVHRVGFCSSGIANDGTPTMDLMAGAGMMFRLSMAGPSPEGARSFFDMGEIMIRARKDTDEENMFHMKALNFRRHFFGGRHPETAQSLARVGDYLSSVSDVRACFFWSLALEALEAAGERAELSRADLEMRIGRVLLFASDPGEALAVLRRSEERLRRVLGEMSERRLECAIFVAQALYWSGMVSEAGEAFSSVAELLDGAPPRSDPDPFVPSNGALLSTALAGIGAVRILQGDRPGGEALLRRSAGLRVGRSGRRTVECLGDMFRKVLMEYTGTDTAKQKDAYGFGIDG
jgi:hypothetical protein